MERILKRIKANVMVSALICIALGVVLVVWPGGSRKIVCMAIGVVLVINGISRLLNFIFGRDGSVFSQMNLVMGIIITVIGGWILFQPGTIIAMIPILVGIIIVIHGINNLQQTVSLCQSRYDKWWVALLLALVTIGFGVLLIFNPFAAVDTLIRFIGIFLIYDGVSDIWIMSRVSKNVREARQEMEALTVDGKEIE
ncbi:MAG: DUF308 domain-containing protein [Lachnospiraceae bacterium]|nr:DUF308 domain-containing protein [Lachnospiraceae bacterium]